MKIAKGHQPVMPYLILNGADAFIKFAQTVFNATEVYKGYRDDNSERIMHAEIQINGCNIMMADVTDDFDAATSNLFVYVDNADETYNLALENGATAVSEIEDQDYGRSGGVRDPFGNVWWINSLK